MNIDERIRKELHDQGDEVDALDLEEKSLFGMLNRVFTGGLARWAAFAMVLTLLFVGLTVWCGYEFFTAVDVDDRVFWGILAAVAFHGLSMFKLWFFMEMNRNSVTREVKRIEVALARLEENGMDRQ